MARRFNHSFIPHFASVLALAFVPQLGAQTISFTAVAPSVLENRLKNIPASNQERVETLKNLFKEAGCTQISEQTVKGSDTPNVICTLPGSEKGVVVVGAHYDKPSKGDGVINNWSGAALLPSLLESINKTPRRMTFVFVGFTDQQKGLRGSKAYARDLKKGTVKAMLNIDSVGMDATKVWVAKSDKDLVSGIARVAASIKVPVTGLDLDESRQVDVEPFKEKSIPTIHFHSITPETGELPGSEKDNLELVKMDQYAGTYRLLAVYLAFLDNVLDRQPAPQAN